MATNISSLSRGEMLKKLRQEHDDTVKKAQVLLKEQKRIQREICKFIRESPKSIPEIAEEVGLTTMETLWYVASYKKYGIVVEEGMCEDYPLYKKAEEN